MARRDGTDLWAAVLLAALLTACSGPGPDAAPAAPPDSTNATTAGDRPADEPTSPAPARSGNGPWQPGEVDDVATGLHAPWDVVFVDGTALVSERDSGDVLEVGADGTVRIVGTVPGVVHAGESGLLGLAVDGRDRLYAYSTGADGNRIQRFALTGAPGSFGLGPGETILAALPSANHHDGGRIAFGPDGMLYAGVGDAGMPALAQDRGSLAGKILRMTPDGTVPGDNPDPASLVYSSGHRNVQGLAWAADGTMLASEFGQDTWDELNIIVAGANYGWPVVEGMAGDPRFTDPVQQWDPDVASPSGIAVVGQTVLLANLRGQVLRAVPLAAPGTARDHFVGTYGRLRAVVPAPDGSVWLVTNNTDGRGAPQAGDDRIVRVRTAP